MKHPPPPRIRRPKPKPLTKREFAEQYKRAEILLAAAACDGEMF